MKELPKEKYRYSLFGIENVGLIMHLCKQPELFHVTKLCEKL